MGAKRILIVDADSDSRAVYRIILQHHGYDVLEAETGAELRHVVQSQHVDLIVMELTLKREDGYTVIEELRQNPGTKGICVVVVTARALHGDEDRAQTLGCELFLLKPVEPKVLVGEIERVLRRPPIL